MKHLLPSQTVQLAYIHSKYQAKTLKVRQFQTLIPMPSSVLRVRPIFQARGLFNKLTAADALITNNNTIF